MKEQEFICTLQGMYKAETKEDAIIQFRKDIGLSKGILVTASVHDTLFLDITKGEK